MTILEYGTPEEQSQAKLDLRLLERKRSRDDPLPEPLASPGKKRRTS